MKYLPDEHRPVLELTRRNLATLLAKLDDPNSHRTLLSPALPGEPVIAVRAVEDVEHYADRAPGPTYTNRGVGMSELCCDCGSRPVRSDWLTVHDDGTAESMWSEALAGRSLYCQTCYDELGDSA